MLEEPYYSALSVDIPLLLLPVRIETLLVDQQLNIRIFPDVLHGDRHALDLSQEEIQVGRAFWKGYFRAVGDHDRRLTAFTWLVGVVGPWRAAWVVRRTRPTNADQAPSQPPPEGVAPTVPIFAPLSAGVDHTAMLARLLPVQWLAAAYLENELVLEGASNLVVPDLAMAPDLAADGGSVLDARDFLDTQALQWMRDFTEAMSVGMAISAPLPTDPAVVAEQRFDELIVYGIANGDRAADFETLLVAHQFTHGLGLLPQGAPTNNTSSTKSVSSASNPDLEQLLQVALDDGSQATVTPLTPNAADELLSHDVGSVTEVALGLSGASPLQTLPGRDDQLMERARAMVDTLYMTMYGWLLNVGLEGVMQDADLETFREWCHQWLRGCAQLATLQVGTHPVGILPHTLFESHNPPRNDFFGRFEDIVSELRFDNWINALEYVSSFSTDAPATPGPGEPDSVEDATADLARVLGAVPHPMQLRTRNVSHERQQIIDQYVADKNQVLTWLQSGGANYVHDELVQEIEPDGPANGTAYSEVIDWETARDNLIYLYSPLSGTLAQAEDLISNQVLPALQGQQARSYEFLSFGPTPPAGNGGIRNDIRGNGPLQFYAVHEAAETPVDVPLVSNDGDATAVAGWLGALADWMDGGAEPTEPPGLPLLFQLARSACRIVQDNSHLAAVGSAATTDRLTSGLRRLAQVATEPTVADPIDELGRLLRECLGLGTHRLDAFEIGLTLQRLAAKRRREPVGLHIGGFGWVVDLHWEQSASEDMSQGYVHAPSLTHAATAAVLRSGWNALGTPQSGSGVAVDLSSRKIQRAKWILDGVRRGQDLRELLGARFERNLHEARLDAWIDDIRMRVLENTGRADEPPVMIVDGLMLARAFSDPPPDTGTDEANVRAGLENLMSTGLPDGASTSGEEILVLGYLDELFGDFDACGDVLLAQSVHGLVSGTVVAAGASASALGSGNAPIPPIDMPDTPRKSRALTHRVVVPFSASSSIEGPTWSGADSSPLRYDGSHLERWVSGLLPSPTDVVLQATWSWSHPVLGPLEVVESVSLDDVGLSALEAVCMVSDSEELRGSGLDSWLRSYLLENPRQPDPNLPPPPVDTMLELDYERFIGIYRSSYSLEQWAVLAHPLGRLLRRSRIMSEGDLGAAAVQETSDPLPAGTPPGEIHPIEDELQAATAALLTAIDTGAEILAAMRTMARFAFDQALPLQLTDWDALVVQARSLHDRALKRLDKLVKARDRETEQWGAFDDARRRASILERISLAAGWPLPLANQAACFRLTNAVEARDTFADSMARVVNPLRTRGWLRQLAEVRPSVALLSEVLDVSEAMADAPHTVLSTGQFPYVSGDPWFATATLPSDRHASWLHVLKWDVPGTSFTLSDDQAEEIFGFTVDSWNESIPLATQDTGIAVNLDAPSTKAPSAALLLVPRDTDTEWSQALIRDLIKSALDGARYRAVGSEHLERWGQYLPAIFISS